LSETIKILSHFGDILQFWYVTNLELRCGLESSDSGQGAMTFYNSKVCNISS